MFRRFNCILLQWVCRQRGEYIKRIEGRKSHLSDHRVAQLDEIGFVWSKAPTLKLSLPAEENSSSATNDNERIVPHSRATLWSIRVEQLKAFKADNGHCLVPKIYKVNQSLSRVSNSCCHQSVFYLYYKITHVNFLPS